MFIRRFYYDLTTGRQLLSYYAEGAIVILPVNEEAANLGLENWGVFEWNEKIPEIESAFSDTDADGNPREVRPYVEGGELKFEYTPIVVPDDPYKIIDTLTGEVE